MATSRPHLLLVEEASGGTTQRCAVECFARVHGWPLVNSPADADILVLAGGPSGLGVFTDRIWDQLPGPRSRVQVTHRDDVAAALDRARRQLADFSAQRRDERRMTLPAAGAPSSAPDPHAGHTMEPPDPHAGHTMNPPDPHAGHTMNPPDPHAGHTMNAMDMPAGLAMAERAPDRDGLKLDVLSVPWGPALPWWPAGLVITTTLQGDVVQAAEVERLGDLAAQREGWTQATVHLDPPSAAAVVRLDALMRLLAIAGWDGARITCQRLRDELLAGPRDQDVSARVRRLARRVVRSRPFARMTTGVTTTQDEDVAIRYRRWLAETVAAVTAGTLPATVDLREDAARQLPELLVGKDVAAARLVVASLDLELSGAAAQVVAHA